jgi:hypothetical protein
MRECGKCSLCCKVFPVAVEGLNKPGDTWCQHCKPGKGGCGIYDSRPPICREFQCGWLMWDNMPDVWFPARSKMVVTNMEGTTIVTVDPDYPNAWRREPYFSQLMEQSRVRIRIGTRIIDPHTGTVTYHTREQLEGSRRK